MLYYFRHNSADMAHRPTFPLGSFKTGTKYSLPPSSMYKVSSAFLLKTELYIYSLVVIE